MQESSPTFSPVQPVRTAAPYLGGKRNLSRRIVKLIETIPHRTYAEPFVGMGGIFLRRRLRPEAEVINDWSQDVSTFYRILQRHYAAFLDMLKFQITTRTEFERLMAVNADTLTDLERAARFLYLQRTAFGGKIDGRAFGVSRHQGGRMNMLKLGSILEDLHERLADVVIERLDFEDFLKRYDSPDTLFYLDPPYYGGEADYGADLFSRTDYQRLADVLAALAGKFVLSINDRAPIRRAFAGFQFEEVETTYTVAGGGGVKAAELIITGGRA